jgi:hypothetical protein
MILLMLRLKFALTLFGSLQGRFGRLPEVKMLNEDYKDILQLFTDNNVKYLVVGAYALGAYGFPRATGREKDSIDIKNLLASKKKIRDYSSILLKHRKKAGQETRLFLMCADL